MLGGADPATTTLHFTFAAPSMMQFFKNWLHFVRKAGIASQYPVVIGAADKQMFVECTKEEIAAIAIPPGLDVWNYTRSTMATTTVQEGKSDWKYYRHHKSSFLEIGLVKAAFLWELLQLGYDVLISDLDIVWLNPRWEPWMTYRHEDTHPPYREAALIAMSDVLVSTDELDEAFDGYGSWALAVWCRLGPPRRAQHGRSLLSRDQWIKSLYTSVASGDARKEECRLYKRSIHLLRDGSRGWDGAGHIIRLPSQRVAR